MLKTPWVTAKDAQKSLSQYQGIFLKIADQQKSVNPFELQELLEICLPNGKPARDERDRSVNENIMNNIYY